MSSLSERLRIEAEFHDHMVEEDTRWAGFREYGLSMASIKYGYSLVGDLANKIVLDMGCGAGERTLPLIQPDAKVLAFDISYRMASEALELLSQSAYRLGCFLLCQQMAGEQLAFASNSVDVIFGISVLHHLDFDYAIPEIKRVLKPGGKAIFVEPLNHHPIAKLYRAFTPNRHSETEQPLDKSVFPRLEQDFSEVNHKEFYLFSLAAAACSLVRSKKLFDASLGLLLKVDRFIFSRFPHMRKYAWITVMELVN